MTRASRGPWRGPASTVVRMLVALEVGPLPLWWVWYGGPDLWDDPFIAGG